MKFKFITRFFLKKIYIYYDFKVNRFMKNKVNLTYYLGR